MSYGWLNKSIDKFGMGAGGWAGGHGGGAIIIDYGAPTGSGGDGSGTDVVAQWIFDEASGNITDEVNSIVLTAGGTSTYSVAIDAPWNNLTPGIDMSTASEFVKAGGDVNLDLGTSDAVIEFVLKPDNNVDDLAYVFNCTDDASNYGYWTVLERRDGISRNRFNIYMKATDDTVFSAVFNNLSAEKLLDGNTHKYRVACDRSANVTCTLYTDGVGEEDFGSSSFTTMSGKTIESKNVLLNSSTSVGANGADVTYAEVRITVGNATNNSGPT